MKSISSGNMQSVDLPQFLRDSIEKANSNGPGALFSDFVPFSHPLPVPAGLVHTVHDDSLKDTSRSVLLDHSGTSRFATTVKDKFAVPFSTTPNLPRLPANDPPLPHKTPAPHAPRCAIQNNCPIFHTPVLQSAAPPPRAPSQDHDVPAAGWARSREGSLDGSLESDDAAPASRPGTTKLLSPDQACEVHPPAQLSDPHPQYPTPIVQL
jgi:hypothetical protein